MTPAVFGTDEAVELAVVERSGFIESRHSGSAVVLGPDGGVAISLGAPDKPVFPRSSLKPFQAVAVMGAGVHLDGAAAVLATASHAGTPGPWSPTLLIIPAVTSCTLGAGFPAHGSAFSDFTTTAPSADRST